MVGTSGSAPLRVAEVTPSVASPIICRPALAVEAHRGVASVANTLGIGRTIRLALRSDGCAQPTTSDRRRDTSRSAARSATASAQNGAASVGFMGPFSIVRSQPRNFPPLQAWCSAQAQHGIGTTADDPLGALPGAANGGVGSAIGFPGWTGRPGKSLFGSVNHRTHLLIANVPGCDKHLRAVQRDAALDIGLGLARDWIDGIKGRAVV